MYVASPVAAGPVASSAEYANDLFRVRELCRDADAPGRRTPAIHRVPAGDAPGLPRTV